MITAEEFFRNKLRELHPFSEVITLSKTMITAEQGMRWAHEFKQLHLHNVSGSDFSSSSVTLKKEGYYTDNFRTYYMDADGKKHYR